MCKFTYPNLKQAQANNFYFCRGKKYGETADECAEAFFYYGKSLLELARYGDSLSFSEECLV